MREASVENSAQNPDDPTRKDLPPASQRGHMPGVHMAGTTPQPAYDPDEPWSELPQLKKVSPAAAFDLVNVLRKAGVPVLGPKARRAGIFSGGKVDVTLSVPERLRSEAALIVARHFPDQVGR